MRVLELELELVLALVLALVLVLVLVLPGGTGAAALVALTLSIDLPICSSDKVTEHRVGDRASGSMTLLSAVLPAAAAAGPWPDKADQRPAGGDQWPAAGRLGQP